MTMKGEQMKYFEIMFPDGYSILIKGIREPSIDEAKEFLKEDMKNMGYTEIDYIEEWKLSDALTAFDFDNVEHWPVFGA